MKLTYLSVLAGLIALLSAGNASAQTTCDTDKDCPGTTCGSQVCVKSSGGSACMDANTAGESGVSDGWCNTDDDCKCKSMGATCGGFFCSFTIPPDGGATGGSGGSTGTGGSTGSAGTSGGGGGGGGCSVAGAPSLAGAVGMGLLAAALISRRARRRI